MIETSHKSLRLAYLSVVLVAFLIEWLLSGLSFHALWNLIENVFFAVILILMQLFFNKTRYAYTAFIVLFSIFVIFAFFESVYYSLFKTYFSASAIFVTLDSNYNEAKEFVNFYLNSTVIILIVVFLLLLVFGILANRKIKNLAEISSIKKSSTKILAILLMLIFMKFSKLIDYNLPYHIVRSSIDYVTEMNVLDNYKENSKGNFQEVRTNNNESDEELYVVIIGESTVRSHLGLYGYYRETTPKLDSMANDLLIYNDVISSNAYSTASLTKALTLGNSEHPENVGKGSIIQLINSVGFETYWLSNQQPIGPHESAITKIGLSSNTYVFTNTTVAGNSNVHDEVLLDELDNALQDDKKKKVVFLHLLGTHIKYENRYTKAFDIFRDEPITNFKSDENFKKINQYDNAVLYNDYLISEVIRKVKSLNLKSFVFYFSDHGEEVFDTIDMIGHNEDIYSKPMFDIPFFLWQSDTYKNTKQISFIEDRKYMLDDLFHSMADLLNIHAKEVEPERSIFSEAFRKRERIIKHSLNYDEFFKN